MIKCFTHSDQNQMRKEIGNTAITITFLQCNGVCDKSKMTR